MHHLTPVLAVVSNNIGVTFGFQTAILKKSKYKKASDDGEETKFACGAELTRAVVIQNTYF